MKNQLYIPKKINAGFQEREGTYTGLLAYIIYWDDKGKLRKETSWNSWRSIPGENKGWRGEDGEKYGDNVANREIENVPTEGFVLNKGVGGTRDSYGWNARNEYIRIYDPRGFEFEVSVANLLFILQECTSTKGKGLEGEFIYSWEGTELVLLPCSSQEYKESSEFTSLQGKKIGRTDMLAGCGYTSKDNKKLIYLGRHDYSEMGYVYEDGDKHKYYRDYHYGLVTKKLHIFIDENWTEDDYGSRYVTQKGFTKLATRDTEVPVDNYSDLLEGYQTSTYGTKPKEFKLTPKTIDWDDKEDDSWRNTLNGTYYQTKGDKVIAYNIWEQKNYSTDEFEGYVLSVGYAYRFKDGELIRESSGNDREVKKRATLDKMEFFHCEIELETGNNVELKEYR